MAGTDAVSRLAIPADPIPAIVVTGPVGAGKSTVAEAVAEVLGHNGIRHVLIDMDHLRSVHPHSGGIPYVVRLGLRNLAAIWPNYRSEGIRCAILADVVESRDQIATYEEAMPGTAVTVVRLDVPMPILLKRLEARETEITIEWYRQRASELQAIMERGQVEDILIDVGERSPHDVAREIIRRCGLANGTA